METKFLGIFLSILGIAGLILALAYMNGADSSKHVSLLLASGILGAISFFLGIRLIPGERPTGKRIEVSPNRVTE
jgi:hypothetical protein